MPSAAIPELTAIFVARAWFHGDPPRLAARITWTHDVTQPERVNLEAAGGEEIAAALRRWLDELPRAPRTVTRP